MTKKDNAL